MEKAWRIYLFRRYNNFVLGLSIHPTTFLSSSVLPVEYVSEMAVSKGRGQSCTDKPALPLLLEEQGRRRAEPPCAGTDLHLSAWRQGEHRTAKKGCAAPWVYLGDLTQAARAESHICCAEGHDKLSPSQEAVLCDTRVCYIPRSSVAQSAAIGG